jgi:large subunit ribosomal protein L7/L12
MTRCTFCDQENPPGATSCGKCHAELPDAPDAAQQPDVDPPDVDPLMDLVRSGKKIEAIKIYRQRMGVGLKEAKEAIEALQRGETVPVPPAVSKTFAESDVRDFVSLLRQGKTIAAIKLYREKTGVGLAEAKAAVETLAAEQGIPIKGSGCAALVLACCLLGLVAVAIVCRM